MKIYNSVCELIGNTPLLKLNIIKEKYGLNADIFAKLEYFNPGGSVKDRVALHIIEQAEKEVEDIYYNIIAEILHEREIGPKALNEMIEDEDTLKELVICKAKRKLDKTLIKMCDKIDIKHINLKWGLSGAGLVALGKFMEIDPLAYVGIGMGKSWDEFKALGWRAIIITVLVIAATYYGAAIVAHVVLVLTGVPAA